MTKIKIFNTAEDVMVWITLGSVAGCLQDVSQIPWVESGSGLQGSFSLPGNSSVEAWAPDGMGFNGNISFGSPPMNCPPIEFPDGINLFEFMLNNGFQDGVPQETIDISCVDGVNAYMEVAIIDNKTPWNAGPNVKNVAHFSNELIYRNSGSVGVYPFKCDICTGSANPPDCGDGKKPAKPQDEPICNVQRVPTDDDCIVVLNFNGLIK